VSSGQSASVKAVADSSSLSTKANPTNTITEAGQQKKVAVSGSDVYVVWVHDINFTNSDIFFRKSTDDGNSFGSTKNLSNNAGISVLPRIAVARNNVYVVWTDNTRGNNEIFFKKSTDDGNSFGSTVNLSRNLGDSRGPEISVAGYSWNGTSLIPNVYVVWQDKTTPNGNSDIFFKKSTDGGNSFGSTVNLSRNPGDSYAP